MRIFYSIVLLLFAAILSAQPEFMDNENGLIYSNEAMNRLRQIVDTENQQFRVCDFKKEFLSQVQTKGTLFTGVDGGQRNLLKELQSGISQEDFRKKYTTDAPIDVLAVKNRYVDYDGDDMVQLEFYPAGKDLRVTLREFEKYNTSNGFVYKNKYNDELFVVFYESKLQAKKIPLHYAKMLQYSECLIDTTTTIHSKKAIQTGMRYRNNVSTKKFDTFWKYVNSSFGSTPPDLDEDEDLEEEAYNEYFEKVEVFESERNHFVNTILHKEPRFIALLSSAYEEAVDAHYSNFQLDDYVERYLSKQKALTLKRNKIVVGSCSMDSSPREHAREIARLAAESYSWNVFLRAHLNIMNDNFQRVSDGSYAQAGRQTYIKELEALNINVKDLLFGIALRASNPSENHYYGSVRRLGRAMAESDALPAFKRELLLGIKNNQLDDFNRIMFFYLYSNLQYNIDIKENNSFNKKHVEEVRAYLPDYLQTIDY